MSLIYLDTFLLKPNISEFTLLFRAHSFLSFHPTLSSQPWSSPFPLLSPLFLQKPSSFILNLAATFLFFPSFLHHSLPHSLFIHSLQFSVAFLYLLFFASFVLKAFFSPFLLIFHFVFSFHILGTCLRSLSTYSLSSVLPGLSSLSFLRFTCRQSHIFFFHSFLILLLIFSFHSSGSCLQSFLTCSPYFSMAFLHSFFFVQFAFYATFFFSLFPYNSFSIFVSHPWLLLSFLNLLSLFLFIHSSDFSLVVSSPSFIRFISL